MDGRRIVAMGGGGFSMEPENPLLDAFVLSLAPRERPRVCFVATASGDADGYVAGFYRAFAALDCRPADLGLFEPPRRRPAGVRARAGRRLRRRRQHRQPARRVACARPRRGPRRGVGRGVVLCGISAGMNCCFRQSVTDSFDVAVLAPLDDGLGLLAGSACPHYDGEDQRRPTYRWLVAGGVLEDGWAADDGAALVFAGEALEEVVCSRPGAAAYRVMRRGAEAVEERVEARFLGAAGPP